MSAAGTAPEGIDPDLWGTMTEEERAGIAGTEYTEAELASIKKLAAKDPGADDDDDSDDDQDPETGADATETKPSDSKAPAADPGAPAAGDHPAAAAEAPAANAAPVYKAELPSDFDARVQSVKDKEAKAWSDFESGDKTRDELQAELSNINAEREELNGLKIKAEISSDMSAQTVESQWKVAVNHAMAEAAKPENGGIDYAKDAAKLADFDQFVKVLAAKDENANKSMEWFLTEAHKRVRALHGIEAKPADTPAAAADRRKPDLKAVPQTLAMVPGGDGPGDVGTEFAEIDQLDGDELEAAIAAMSPEKRARFAAGR